MTCGCCVFLFPFVCLVCILKIIMPIVSSLQSLTLGTRVLHCGLSEQDDTPVMDQSLTLIDTGLVLDGPPGDPASSGQPEVPISASDQL